MVFSIRREVDFADIPGSLAGLKGIPIELALPHRLDDLMAVKDRFGELEDFIFQNGIQVAGLHATQGSLIDDNFLSWAIPTMEFGRLFGVLYCVFHPNRCAKTRKADVQIMATQHLRELQRAVPEVRVCLESFSRPDRVYTPEEIVASPYPLVLDLSHLDPGRSYTLIEDFHPRIGIIHVSEVAYHEEYRKTQSHMPIGPTCKKAFKLLKKARWDGVLTLEYLFEFHQRMFIDRTQLEREWDSI